MYNVNKYTKRKEARLQNL